MKKTSFFSALLPLLTALLLACARAPAEGEYATPERNKIMWLASPLIGWNHDDLKQRDRAGQVKTMSETALEYGLFVMAAHPRFVVNDFLFFTEAAGDTDVLGNFFHANVYGNPEAPVTWNLGAGHLYHKIKPPNEDIDVHVPMAKAGVVLRVKQWDLAFNPYVGYAWERVYTLHGNSDNDSYLYGLTVDWRWRMLALNAKYYFQDSREADEDYNNVHVRFTTGLTQHWGAVLRFDYMEHSTTDDTSLLAGPVFVF